MPPPLNKMIVIGGFSNSKANLIAARIDWLGILVSFSEVISVFPTLLAKMT